MARSIWQVEIRVHDLAKAMHFFGHVFDWEVTPAGDGYAMFDTGVAPLGSLWAIGESGMPLGICHYVASDDCEADAARAVALGGRVVVERSEVPDVGTWTDTLDPWNNEIAFWQADTPGTPDFTGSGANPLSWLELGSPDFAAASRYYAELLGWHFAPVEGMADYGICEDAGPGIGLVGGARGGKLRGITPYVTVGDLDGTCAKVTKAGGQVLGTPVDLGDGSRFGLVERK
jgi:predicted enzyme related to lactoylglutathione lyase